MDKGCNGGVCPDGLVRADGIPKYLRGWGSKPSCLISSRFYRYQKSYLKIMYIQNDYQGLIHVMGAGEKMFNDCVSQNCESQPITHNHFLEILYDPT